MCCQVGADSARDKIQFGALRLSAFRYLGSSRCSPTLGREKKLLLPLRPLEVSQERLGFLWCCMRAHRDPGTHNPSLVLEC